MRDRETLDQALHELASFYIELSRRDDAAIDAARSNFEKKYKELEELGGPLFFRERLVEKIKELQPSPDVTHRKTTGQSLHQMALKLVTVLDWHRMTVIRQFFWHQAFVRYKALAQEGFERFLGRLRTHQRLSQPEQATETQWPVGSPSCMGRSIGDAHGN